MNAQRFLFGEDLSRPGEAKRVEAERVAEAERAAIATAEQAAFARGVAAGREEAGRETERLKAAALERVAGTAASALAAIDSRIASLEGDALAFFDVLARKLARRALADAPLAAVRDAASEAFGHLRGVPHLAARVHESLVDDVEALLRAMARERGFEGRLIVIGSDDLAPGDARLEWADGGVHVDRASLERAADAALAALRTSPLHTDTSPAP